MGYHIFQDQRGKTLAELLFEAGDPVSRPCGGNGKCGKCRVLASGELSPPDDEELALLGDYAARGYRLACVARALGRVELTNEAEEASAEAGAGALSPEEPAPLCDGVSIAIDVGTTTVAVMAIDNSTLAPIKTTAFVNPQRSVGADVMSRLAAICERPSAALEMRDMLLCELDRAIKELTKLPPTAIAVCANTVMEHILCSLDARGIASYPFTPSSLLGGEYDLPIAPVPAFVFPCVAGYVGGDVTAGMVACGLDRAKESMLLLDLGTNGEIALSHGGKIYTASTAAGPAFEGGNLECGMCAGRGAIERVWIEDQRIKWATRDGEEPVGICGSAALDALAAMLRLGIVDETGAMEDDRYSFTEKVWLSDADIRALQLAKAAICAGIRTLCDTAGISEREIKRTLIAGSFGAHLDPESAVCVGIVPRCLEGTIEAVGNAALNGAALWLTDAAYRKRLDKISDSIVHVELSLSRSFNEHYIEEMTFE